MEKYSQYRDRASGIAPFFPISTQPSGIYLPIHIILFLVRLPILFTLVLSYFFIVQWFPIGSLGKKAALWAMLGTPGIWWIDLQIDGVRRGELARHHEERFPQPGTVIASSLTSPVDAIYLAAIFDPVFTACYPSTRLVHRISLLQAVARAFSEPQISPPENAKLVDLHSLVQKHSQRAVVVFPECTTSNGKGILPFGPSILGASPQTKIFPTSLRYTPGDITSPVPGSYFTFLWNLLSKPTHCIRVRIAENVYNLSHAESQTSKRRGYNANYLDTLQDDAASSTDTLLGSDEGEETTEAEKRVLDKIGEALARLGRVKRVGLGVKEKAEFVKAWARQRKRS